MMGGSLRLLFFSALGLASCWGSCLLSPAFSERVARRDAAWYSQAFPGRSAQERRAAIPEGEGWRTVSPYLGSEVRGAMRSALPVVRRHLRVAWGWGPFFFGFFAVSILVGLFARERLTLGTFYASPSASYAAKRLVGATALALIIWCLGPVAAPYWGFYPLCLVGMSGGVGYLANLPLRL